jgi:S1-C subfamily serine protease
MNTIKAFNIALGLGLVLASTVPGTVAYAAAVQNEVVAVPVLAAGTETQPVNLVKLATNLEEGEEVGVNLAGLCLDVFPIRWDAAAASSTQSRLTRIFAKEVKEAGFKTGYDPNSLFKQEEPAGDFLIAASLNGLRVDTCVPSILTSSRKFKGRASYGFEWQIYSNVEKRVIATVRTSGAYNVDQAADDGLQRIHDGAITIAVRKFLASPEFRAAFIGRPTTNASAPTQTVLGNKLSPLSYSNKNNGPSAISDGIGGVVAIFTGDGMGSGFLIGSEGLLLTNHHVVGKDKFVKIRWPDGLETVGEVLRSDAKRDVALVKTDPRGRAPLKLAAATPQPGEDVYAIGTPADPKLQSTVTKGIVSANRVFDGMSFIQSDVSVTHGNSGGPLLDKNANVVGITDLGYQPTGEQINVNLFIPIRDALDFLALKPAG